MKQIVSLLLLVLLVASLTACSQQAVPLETTAPAAQTEAQITPSETPIPSPSPTPEPKMFVPEDIFGSVFNPYSDVAFPDNFNIYGASFHIGIEKMGGGPHYILSMTAEGQTEETIIFLGNLAGLEDEQAVAQNTEYIKNGGFCEFKDKDGTTFTIRKTNPDDDRYEYVDGCHIDIFVNLTDAVVPQYISLVRDNFNVNALALVADYFDTTPVFEECSIAVNLHKKETNVDMRYPVADVAAVQNSMVENVKSNWYDAQNEKMGLSYGLLSIEYFFDIKDGNIYVNERSSELKSVLSAYIEAEISLVKLGFGFDQLDVCGVYEQHEPHYMSVAIHRPEWGEFNDNWNIEFMDEVNGYLLRITYHALENKYHITVDKNNVGAAFDYLPTTNEYTGEYPDQDTVIQMFNNAFGTEGNDFYEKPIAYFKQLVQERFSMSIEELYALPIR